MDLRALIEKLKRLDGVREVAERNLKDMDSELSFRRLGGEDYVTIRLSTQLDDFEAGSDRLDTRILWYKVVSYVIGVMGGFLVVLSLEVDCCFLG